MKLLSPLAPLFFAVASGALAQPPGTPPPPSPLVKALDADQDGTLSAAEIASASVALAALDKNKDGQLTGTEFRPAHPPGGGGMRPRARPNGSRNNPGQPPAPPLDAALDADGDGTISAAELARATAALLTLDQNGDGQLTPDEFAPPPPPQGGPEGGPQGGGPGQSGPAGAGGQAPGGNRPARAPHR